MKSAGRCCVPIQSDDVCFNKGAIIERSIRRVHEEYAADPELKNYTHIDALTLNLERACQAAIDWAMHLVARDHLGMPQSSADAFRVLAQAKYISDASCRAMMAMTGFRNIAIHEYQEMDMSVLHEIAKNGWRSLVIFASDLGITLHP
jgi:uncharacterized protein YutE (UPF0331/DUF86 family)